MRISKNKLKKIIEEELEVLLTYEGADPLGGACGVAAQSKRKDPHEMSLAKTGKSIVCPKVGKSLDRLERNLSAPNPKSRFKLNIRKLIK